MSPRPDVSQERRAQIIAAAVAAFTRLGFDRASMDDIVAEAGLSKGAIYWYFKSKDELILAILDQMFAAEVADLQALASAPGLASRRLTAFFRRTVDQVQSMVRWMPITYEFYALAFRNATVRQAIKRYLRRYGEIIRPIIEQGVAAGEFRALDATGVAVALGAVIEGTLLLWVFDPDLVKIGEHMTAGFDLILAGLQNETGLQK